MDNDRCTNCGRERETDLHLFLECAKVCPLWLQVSEIITRETGENIVINYENVVKSDVVDGKTWSPYNVMVIMTKQYIYQKRCLKQQISRYEHMQLMYSARNIEKYYAAKNNRMGSCVKRWIIDLRVELANQMDYINDIPSHVQ